MALTYDNARRVFAEKLSEYRAKDAQTSKDAQQHFETMLRESRTDSLPREWSDEFATKMVEALRIDRASDVLETAAKARIYVYNTFENPHVCISLGVP